MTAETPEPQSPFRQQALEYIATPKPLDDLIQVTSPLAWVLGLGLWLILASIVSWLFWGTIVTHVNGKGLLLTNNEAIVYISALEAQRLQPGMPVQVSPGTARQWEYSRISGQVTAVENLPASPENMLAVLKNPSLVSYFLQKGPVISLRVQLTQELHSIKAYALAPGSLIDVRITVQRQSPWSLLLSR